MSTLSLYSPDDHRNSVSGYRNPDIVRGLVDFVLNLNVAQKTPLENVGVVICDRSTDAFARELLLRVPGAYPIMLDKTQTPKWGVHQPWRHPPGRVIMLDDYFSGGNALSSVLTVVPVESLYVISWSEAFTRADLYSRFPTYIYVMKDIYQKASRL